MLKFLKGKKGFRRILRNNINFLEEIADAYQIWDANRILDEGIVNPSKNPHVILNTPEARHQFFNSIPKLLPNTSPSGFELKEYPVHNSNPSHKSKVKVTLFFTEEPKTISHRRYKKTDFSKRQSAADSYNKEKFPQPYNR